jgi:hypothetical protein
MSPTTPNDFPQDYAERIEHICREAIIQFNSCHDDLLAQIRVCCNYFETGEQEGISHGELIDFLGISSPSVLDRAGYSNTETLQVMKALSLITYDSEGKPHAPSSLPVSFTTQPPKQTDLRF